MPLISEAEEVQDEQNAAVKHHLAEATGGEVGMRRRGQANRAVEVLPKARILELGSEELGSDVFGTCLSFKGNWQYDKGRGQEPLFRSGTTHHGNYCTFVAKRTHVITMVPRMRDDGRILLAALHMVYKATGPTYIGAPLQPRNQLEGQL